MNSAEQRAICCLRCSIPMRRVHTEQWQSGNLLLRQMQKIADGAGVQIYHCQHCGKIEFFKSPEWKKL